MIKQSYLKASLYVLISFSFSAESSTQTSLCEHTEDAECGYRQIGQTLMTGKLLLHDVEEYLKL